MWIWAGAHLSAYLRPSDKLPGPIGSLPGPIRTVQVFYSCSEEDCPGPGPGPGPGPLGGVKGRSPNMVVQSIFSKVYSVNQRRINGKLTFQPGFNQWMKRIWKDYAAWKERKSDSGGKRLKSRHLYSNLERNISSGLGPITLSSLRTYF